ncbi:Sugar kinase of the NBD/HSP70 family, may contain an N-terminal HTH domain [Nonomuraea solani]|uniref:Sugar kinase of the NBD/HSP70 family, may contain an N-terminal HTH domain n=1 Tax=Nonomuraea solani TaxID=1144553 RepID=A0A1H6E1M8_9ACTN|nr:ROK family transcriptional regulator [Nonomuraea solani]SEG91291.1 Sugar kinase of the NBD/HSP70 family, may contain an N-terminal HTH domain [Nonomuraea solani]
MNGATTSGELRAHNRVRLLRAVHDCGASRTRSQLTRDLGLARGTASVLVAGLADDGLLHEEPAPEHARGRPTQIPGPHPLGPLALAADIREDAWELAACELGGRVTIIAVRPHDGTPEDALVPLGEAMAAHRAQAGYRVIGAGVALAGPVRHGGLVDIAHLGWRSVDVPSLLGVETPLIVGNDTALAALAEARRGRLRGVRVGLHLHVDFDLGGVLVVDGRPLGGASGTGAEFGHMPLTGGDRPCPCGAIGCWGMDVGANALLRHVGLAYGGGRGREQAEQVLATSQEAVTANAGALGRGVAALVNAHDPEAVTLSGHGRELLERAGDALQAACEPALMAIRRDRPPRIEGSALGWRGSLLGAMESVFDAFLTPEGLGRWRKNQPDQARDTPDRENVMHSTPKR